MVNESDVVLYLSGAGVTQPVNSFGGAIQTTKVINLSKQNLFPRTTLAEALTGINKYLCLYVKNDNSSEDMNNVVAHLAFNTDHEFDEVKIGKGSSGKGGTEQRVSNILTAPTNIDFKFAESYNTGLPLGQLKFGEFYPIWFWLNVSINNKPLSNRFGLNLTFDPPPGSTTGGSGSGGGTGGGGTNNPPATLPDFSVAVASDFSCNSEAQRTASNMRTFTLEHVLTCGDLSYDSNGNCWISLMGNLIGKVIFASGNHDASEGSGDELIQKYLQAIGQSNSFGVHKFKNVMVVYMNQYESFSSGSQQYNTIKGALEAEKNNSNILWRIAMFHEPLYSAPSHHENLESFRNIWHPIFDANKVDLMLTGHNHNYQRTHPLTFNSANRDNPTTFTTGAPNYTNPTGVMHVVVGTAGRDRYSIDSSPSYLHFSNASTFGFLVLDWTSNGKIMTGKFYRNNGLTILDQWSITKT